MQNKPIEIIVQPEDKKLFIDQYKCIQYFIEARQDIPYDQVSQLFQLMQNPQVYRMNELFKEAERYSRIAIEKLNSIKGYQIKWKSKTLKDGRIVQYDSAKVVFELLYAFLLYRDEHPKTDKDDAIIFFYQAFDVDYKSLIEENVQENFTPYKQAIITGILAIAIGFQLTAKPDPINEGIFQSTRNAIKKYRKEV